MSEKAKVVLHIPSMEALEDIVGKMEEAGLSVKAAIVQEFAAKHLKQVAVNLNVKPVAEAIMKDLEKCATETVLRVMADYGISVDISGNVYNRSPVVKAITPQLEGKIGVLVLHKLDELVKHHVAKAVEGLDMNKLANHILQRFEHQVGAHLEQHLKDRLAKALESMKEA